MAFYCNFKGNKADKMKISFQNHIQTSRSRQNGWAAIEHRLRRLLILEKRRSLHGNNILSDKTNADVWTIHIDLARIS